MSAAGPQPLQFVESGKCDCGWERVVRVFNNGRVAFVASIPGHHANEACATCVAWSDITLGSSRGE